MSGPSSISRRIESCIGCIAKKEYEPALMHFFPALDKTAKRRRPTDGVGERIRRYLEDEEDLISAVSIGNILKGVVVAGVSFPEAIYKFGRTTIAHEGELDPRLQISDSTSLKIGSTWHLPASYLVGLSISVVVAPENSLEKIGKPISVRFLGSTFQVDDLWGKKSMVRKIIAEKFSPPP